jgi:hypothetical protein
MKVRVEAARQRYTPSAMPPVQSTLHNRLILALTHPAYARLADKLMPVTLAARQVLYEPDQPIHAVYFAENAVICQMTETANGFMFAIGASERSVHAASRRGMRGVSSLPGGPSGVPGNPFYCSLLPAWLTNETYPLPEIRQ